MDADERYADLKRRLAAEEGIRHLTESVALADRMHFTVLVCDIPLQADAALEILEAEVARLRHEPVQLIRLRPEDRRPALEGKPAFEQLVDELLGPLRDWQPSDGEAEPVFVIDAARAGRADAETWAAFFQRLNEVRNLLMDRLAGPLLLVLPRGWDIELCYRAPDFWSIRSAFVRAFAAPAPVGTETADGEPPPPERRYSEKPDIDRLRARLADARIRYRDHPDDPSAARALAILLDRLGDYEMDWGRLKDAADAYGEIPGGDASPLASDPERPEWRRDLSVSLIKVGDVHRARGDLAAALAAYEECLEVMRALLAADPDRPEWRRDPGQPESGRRRPPARGDLAAALEAYEEAWKCGPSWRPTRTGRTGAGTSRSA